MPSGGVPKVKSFCPSQVVWGSDWDFSLRMQTGGASPSAVSTQHCGRGRRVPMYVRSYCEWKVHGLPYQSKPEMYSHDYHIAAIKSSQKEFRMAKDAPPSSPQLLSTCPLPAVYLEALRMRRKWIHSWTAKVHIKVISMNLGSASSHTLINA